MAGRRFHTAKQVTFALASAITATAKEAQAASVTDVEETFTIRNSWNRPSNAMGIKALPATKTDLAAAVATRADWLHEEKRTKAPEGQFIAIPGEQVRRTKRDIVRRDQRPKALRGKRDVVLPLKGGGAGLFQRRGKGVKSRLVFLYRLVRRAHIRKQSTVVEPTVRVFEKRFDKIFHGKLREAFRTAR